MEEQPRDEQADPDDEAEEADNIHDGKTANAFFKQLLEVGDQADGEEGKQEEQGAHAVQGAGHGLGNLVGCFVANAEEQHNEEGAHVTEHEAGESIPHIAPGHLLAGLGVGVKVLGPQVGEDEGPHANEHVDEDLDGGGHHGDPAGGPHGAFAGSLGEDQGFCDGTGSDGAAVGLNGQAHVMAPEAMAPPSDLTARPIQPPATMGSVCRNAAATKGRSSISMQVKTTTREETMIGTTGRARMAPPVAIAADTPQMEIPEARGAAHSLLNLKYLRATKYTTAQ